MSENRVIPLSPATEVHMADEWYEFATTDHFWMQWRFNEILKSQAVRQQTKGPWLDIGCGHGQVINQFEAIGTFVIDGCDLNVLALQQVGNVRGKIYVYNIFDGNQVLLGKYTGILLLDVIEHIDDQDAFLAAALRHLEPGGLVVINVPALSALFSRYDEVAGHRRRYTKTMLKSLFRQHGIKEIEIAYWGLLLLPIAWIRKFYLLMVPRKMIIKKGFQPPHPLINTLFKFMMRLEEWLFNRVPLGTSVVAIGRKE